MSKEDRVSMMVALAQCYPDNHKELVKLIQLRFFDIVMEKTRVRSPVSYFIELAQAYPDQHLIFIEMITNRFDNLVIDNTLGTCKDIITFEKIEQLAKCFSSHHAELLEVIIGQFNKIVEELDVNEKILKIKQLTTIFKEHHHMLINLVVTRFDIFIFEGLNEELNQLSRLVEIFPGQEEVLFRLALDRFDRFMPKSLYERLDNLVKLANIFRNHHDELLTFVSGSYELINDVQENDLIAIDRFFRFKEISFPGNSNRLFEIFAKRFAKIIASTDKDERTEKVKLITSCNCLPDQLKDELIDLDFELRNSDREKDCVAALQQLGVFEVRQQEQPSKKLSLDMM